MGDLPHLEGAGETHKLSADVPEPEQPERPAHEPVADVLEAPIPLPRAYEGDP